MLKRDPATIVVLFNYYYIRRFPDFSAWLDRLGIRYFTPTPLALACGVETGRGLALATGAAPADLATTLLPPRPAIDRWDRLGELLPDHRNQLWLDISDPGPTDVALLGRMFGFHELALEDVTRPHERPRCPKSTASPSSAMPTGSWPCSWLPWWCARASATTTTTSP